MPGWDAKASCCPIASFLVKSHWHTRHLGKLPVKFSRTTAREGHIVSDRASDRARPAANLFQWHIAHFELVLFMYSKKSQRGATHTTILPVWHYEESSRSVENLKCFSKVAHLRLFFAIFRTSKIHEWHYLTTLMTVHGCIHVLVPCLTVCVCVRAGVSA